MPSLIWRKGQRILKNDDFKSIFLNGKKLNGRGLRLFFLAGDASKTVFGITLSKKIKGSVVRNYYKRIIREILRNTQPQIKSGWKIVINVPASYNKIDIDHIQAEILGLLRNAKVLLINE
jgi:ribonuclease P protein component